jgi:hypothetical protein
MISNQTCSFLVHDPLFFCIGFHVVTNVVSGYLDVSKDQGHLSKLGLQIIRDLKIDFRSTTQRCWITKDKSVNPINGKSLDDLFKTAQEKIDEIKDQGYAVKQKWECEWGRLKKQDLELKAFITDRQQPCDGRFMMTSKLGLQIIRDLKIDFRSTTQLLVHDGL